MVGDDLADAMPVMRLRKKTKITILAYLRSESWLLGHSGLWSTSLLQRRITLSQPSISTGPPTRPVPQPSPSLIYRRPRPKQFGWFAMIIAVIGRFLIGAAVVAFGTAGTAGESSAYSSGEGDGAEYVRTKELN